MTKPLARLVISLALAALALGSLSPPATAQEWTRFRGPNGTGIAGPATVPATWTEADYNWKVMLPGIGHSSPVLWGSKIFLTSADPKSGARIVFALNAADGSILWKREFSSATYAMHSQNSYASSTPAVDADRIYVAWATPEEYTLRALDHDGKDAWTISLGAFESRHGFATSPMLYEDMVIITNDQDGASFLLAVDRKTGETRWKVPRRVKTPQNASYAVPCIYEPAGGPPQLVIDSWGHGISGHDPRTGKMNWEIEVFPNRPVGQPIVVGDLILGNSGEGSGNNTVAAVRPPKAPGEKPTVAYKIDRTAAPYVPSLIAKGNLVFLWGDRGIVTCIDGPSGKQMWQQRVGGNYSGSPVLVGDRLYAISMTGDVVVIAASDKYEELGRVSLGDPSRATPAVAGGRMYLRTEQYLYSLGGKAL
jgi:outer membrane protein assembly factor BamB